MNYGYLVILFFSMIICIGIVVMRHIVYDEEYDGEFSETIKMFFIIIDMFKDIAIIFCLLHFLLYGTLF